MRILPERIRKQGDARDSRNSSVRTIFHLIILWLKLDLVINARPLFHFTTVPGHNLTNVQNATKRSTTLRNAITTGSTFTDMCPNRSDRPTGLGGYRDVKPPVTPIGSNPVAPELSR